MKTLEHCAAEAALEEHEQLCRTCRNPFAGFCDQGRSLVRVLVAAKDREYEDRRRLFGARR